MSKRLLAIAFTAFLAFSPAAYAASWTASVTAAINAGNFSQIDVIAAANPADQGALAMFLLQQAQGKLATNPDLAAKIFAAAAPYVAQISGANVADAVAIIKTFLDKAGQASFQTAHLQASAEIIAAALQMSAAPNVAAVEPDLNGKAQLTAEDFLARNPQAPQKLKTLVSLAQTQNGGAPNNGVLNPASIPSAE